MFIYMYINNICMSKLIAVSDEAYEKLKRLKNGGSFSTAILGLIDKPRKRSLLNFIDSLDIGVGRKLADDVERVYKKRAKWKLKRVEF